MYYRRRKSAPKRVNPETILQGEIANACAKVGIELKRVNTQGMPILNDGKVENWKKSRNPGACDLTGAAKLLGGRRIEIEVKVPGKKVKPGSDQEKYGAWAVSQGSIYFVTHSVEETLTELKKVGAIK